jgi:hypothetical protein
MATAVAMTDDVLTQRMEALAKGNRIRVANSRIKLAMKDGEVTLRQAMESESCQSAQIMHLVCAVPRMGKKKAAGMFARTQINPYKRVDTLTPRQREVVLTWIEERYAQA